MEITKQPKEKRERTWKNIVGTLEKELHHNDADAIATILYTMFELNKE